VCPRGGLDAVVKRKIPSLAGTRTHESVAKRYSAELSWLPVVKLQRSLNNVAVKDFHYGCPSDA